MPRVLRVCTRGSAAKEKDALRRHKALERHFDKNSSAQSTAVPVPSVHPVFGAMPHHLPPGHLPSASQPVEEQSALDQALVPGTQLNLHQDPAPGLEDVQALPSGSSQSDPAPGGR